MMELPITKRHPTNNTPNNSSDLFTVIGISFIVMIVLISIIKQEMVSNVWVVLRILKSKYTQHDIK